MNPDDMNETLEEAYERRGQEIEELKKEVVRLSSELNDQRAKFRQHREDLLHLVYG